MSAEFVKARLIPYGNTLSGWTATNPIITQGEIVLEVGTPMRAKLGDGVTDYLSLPYITGGVGTPETLQDALDLGNTGSLPGTNSIFLDDEVNKLSLTPPQVKLSDLGTGFELVSIYVDASGDGVLHLKSTSNPNLGVLKASALSFGRTWSLPDNNGTIALLSDIIGAGALQGVLNSGNIATDASGGTYTIILKSTGNTVVGTYDPTKIQFEISGQLYAKLENDSSGGRLWLKDQLSNFLSCVQARNLTANRTYNLPNEGSGSGIGDTFVLHTTKDDINVVVSSAEAKQSAGFFQVSNVLGPNVNRVNIFSYLILSFTYNNTSGSPYSYQHTLEQFQGAGAGGPPPVASSRSISNYLPQQSGQLSGNWGGNNSQVLVGASSVTIPHGLSFTPSRVIPIPRNANTGIVWSGAYVSAITGSDFTITFSAPATITCDFDFQCFE